MSFRAMKFRFLVDFSFVWLSQYFGQSNLYQVQQFLAHSFTTTRKNLARKPHDNRRDLFPLLCGQVLQFNWVNTAFHGKKKLLSFLTWLGESVLYIHKLSHTPRILSLGRLWVTQKNDKNSYSGIFFPSVCNTYNNIGPNMPCVICNLRYVRL